MTTPNPDLGFTHRFVPAPNAASAETLLLLHGTGGDETDLLSLGKMLNPDTNLLSPRGKVLENGMPRFFRRLSEGVFDIPDLIQRAGELAEFTVSSAAAYGFDPKRVTVVGFSNGANIAAALLLLHPGILKAAVLLYPMVPLVPDPLPSLTGTPVFISAGRQDPLVPPEETEKLTALLRSVGADVTVHWQPGGHGLSCDEAQAARDWLAQKTAP